MHIGAKRVFRLSLTTALTLAGAYALALDMPFIAPLFGFMLGAAPKPPMGPKGLMGLVVVLSLTLGIGLLLIPILDNYPAVGLMLVALGLFFSNYLTLNLGKGPVGALLTVGVALISAAGLASFQLATSLIEALIIGIGLAVLCQWIVYPLFPEDELPPAAPPPSTPGQSSWLALRATLIVYPSFLLGLINPSVYLPIVMKAVSLGQQDSVTDARHAGRELLGSTAMGGVLAVLFWIALSMHPNLWMFSLWMLLFALYISSKLYGVFPSRYPPSFWINVMVTLLILLGPAVADSASGKDVYRAFAVRISLFIAVTVYAWAAVVLLEKWRNRQLERSGALSSALEVSIRHPDRVS
jgi:hypothetical protein